MEAFARGEVERFIDRILGNDELLESAYTMFEKGFELSVKNIEDTLYGYVMGRIIQFTEAYFHMSYGRPPTDNERVEIAGILRRRATEIKSKVKIVANR